MKLSHWDDQMGIGNFENDFAGVVLLFKTEQPKIVGWVVQCDAQTNSRSDSWSI